MSLSNARPYILRHLTPQCKVCSTKKTPVYPTYCFYGINLFPPASPTNLFLN